MRTREEVDLKAQQLFDKWLYNFNAGKWNIASKYQEQYQLLEWVLNND